MKNTTLSRTAWKKQYKNLSEKDLDLLREMFAQADYTLFYQEAGRSSSGDKKYRLFLIDATGSNVKRGAPKVTDVTQYLSNIIGSRYNAKDGTLTAYPNIHQWQSVLMDKMGYDIRNHVTLLSFN